MKDMNLNTVRLEGKMEDDEFMDLADKYGMLIMPGWCCCDSWEHWNEWGPEQYIIARLSSASQLKRLRIHPSIFVFVYSSDEIPPNDVETLYLDVFGEFAWPNPLLSAASNRVSTITGPTGVKMTGPYSWVPPNYWFLDKNQYGGAYGFFTEGSPGQNPLALESFNRIIPDDKRWPINEVWNYHCGLETSQFGNLGTFTPSVNGRYGITNSVEDYLEKSQLNAYESHKAMFEAYSRNKYTSTGLIQWMLNNAFPGMIWHLYDYYFNPTSTYFAVKQACEPIHIQYSYDDESIWLVNSLYTPQLNLVARAEVYDIDANNLFQTSINVPRIEPDTSQALFVIPPLGTATTSYFLRLYLYRDTTILISQNFYWLSTNPDVLNWSGTTWWHTPTQSYADHTLLQTLPPINLRVESNSTQDPVTGDSVTQVTINNPQLAIALFIRARVVDAAGKDVWPIFWDDNYISLLPRETRVITAKYNHLGVIQVQTELWNNISGGKKIR
jgi:exo-1,4-beta-D-glucosaminidase